MTQIKSNKNKHRHNKIKNGQEDIEENDDDSNDISEENENDNNNEGNNKIKFEEGIINEGDNLIPNENGRENENEEEININEEDEELGLALESDLLHLVVIDHSGLFVEMVSHSVVVDTGHINGRTVGEVTTVGEVEAHEGITGLQAGHEDSHIRLGAGMGLHVGILGVEELLETIDGQLLDLVNDFAAAVIPGVGITFGVFVGADAAKCLEHLFADEVFRSDEFDAFGLTLLFLSQQVGNFNILFH